MLYVGDFKNSVYKWATFNGLIAYTYPQASSKTNIHVDENNQQTDTQIKCNCLDWNIHFTITKQPWTAVRIMPRKPGEELQEKQDFPKLQDMVDNFFL